MQHALTFIIHIQLEAPHSFISMWLGRGRIGRMLGIEVGRGEEFGKVGGRRWFLEKGVGGGGGRKDG